MNNIVDLLKPVVVMVLMRVLNACTNIMNKLVINDGMNLRIAVAYRFIFATAFIAPIAFFLERKKRPNMTWEILFHAFLCGLMGEVLPQNFQMEAISLTSVTFATSVTNLIPGITFVLSLLFRLEKLNLRKVGGRAKVLGTLIGIGGAMILTFLKGMEIKMTLFHTNLFHQKNGSGMHSNNANSHGGMYVFGVLSAFAANITYAMWFILQVKMNEIYPCQYSSTALMSIVGALLSTIFAFILERDLSQWKLGWNIRLLTVAYGGIVSSGIVVVATSWCIQKRGPLFVSVFNPLMLVVVVFAGSMILNEKLYLGSILGSVVIICGLYMVLWGKSQEMTNTIQPHHESETKVDHSSTGSTSIV